MNNDKTDSSGLLGAAIIAFILTLTFVLWILTANHTTKDMDLLDAIIENKLAGGAR